MNEELTESEKVTALVNLGGFEIVKGFLFDTPKAEDYDQQFFSSEEVFDVLRGGEKEFFMNDDGEVKLFEEAWEYWYDCYCDGVDELPGECVGDFLNRVNGLIREDLKKEKKVNGDMVSDGECWGFA